MTPEQYFWGVASLIGLALLALGFVYLFIRDFIGPAFSPRVREARRKMFEEELPQVKLGRELDERRRKLDEERGCSPS